ncbi:MAG TPA: GcrA family cell cycle regulator [Gemmatimonadales bacterium]|nr:GcrA family cell cycle regulator [Gemmatimonadales bacterium]
MSAEWDEPRTELLKRHWLAGETARTIAEALGGGVTRNAVIGKAHRLGLTGQHGKGAAPARGSVPQARSQKPQRKPRLKNQPR